MSGPSAEALAMPAPFPRRREASITVPACPEAVFAHLDGDTPLAEALREGLTVTEHAPPHRKVWRAVGPPRLVAMDRFEMGFEVACESEGSRLRVWIDYEPGARGLGLWAPSFGEMYARWCVDRMVEDVLQAFPAAATCGAVDRCPLR